MKTEIWYSAPLDEVVLVEHKLFTYYNFRDGQWQSVCEERQQWLKDFLQLEYIGAFDD